MGTAFTSSWAAGLAATAQREPRHRGAAHRVARLGGDLRPRPRQAASPEADASSLCLAGLLATAAGALAAARGGRRPSRKTVARAQAKEHQGTAKSDLEVMRQKLEVAWRAYAREGSPAALEPAGHSLSVDAELRGWAQPVETPEAFAACAGLLLLLACLASSGLLLTELYKFVSTGMHWDAHHRNSLLSLALCMRLLGKDYQR